MSVEREFAKYLAVPYVRLGRTMRGWDCYGLYRFVLAERHGVEVGSYADQYPKAEGRDADAHITAALAAYAHRWQRIEQGTEGEGCGIVFNVLGRPLHCGYVISPGTMLHAMKGRGTCIERYDSPNWIKRIEGLYKWK